MYKNKTLKGLAISAVVALGFSGLAAAPASANYGLADKSFVSVAVGAGEEWNVFASASFTVTAAKASSLTVGTLKLLVEDVAGNLTATSSATANAADSVMPSAWDGAALEGLTRKSATDKSFVIAASASSAITADFELYTFDKTVFSASHEVKITAWNDANNDGLIQSTEYASPTETIKFVDADEVALNVTLNRPFVGDTSISATVTTTPTLNADEGADLEVLKTALGFDLGFNRTGYADTASFDASSIWNSAVTSRNYTFYSEQFDDYTSWAVDTISATALAAGTVSVAVSSSGLATFTTTAAHKAIVGDVFQFSSSSIATVSATVSRIVSTTVFEAAVPKTIATVSAEAITTVGTTTPAFNKVTAGSYGVVPYWKSVAATNIQLATVAVTSADVEVNVAASANNQGITDGAAAAGSQQLFVRSGTTTVEVSATVVDADGDPIAAGRAVVISNTRVGTATINGKTAADTVLTDANGQVKATVVTPAGAAGTDVELTFTPEGVSAADSGVKLTWQAAAFSLRDLSVANGTFSVKRAMLAGGSYAMDLAVTDQWFAAPAATANYRVVVTGAGATNGLVPMTAGRAQVTVADNGTALTYTTELTLQLQAANGTWAAVSGGAKSVVTDIKTGEVVLGAANTSLYGGVTVTLSSAVAAKALIEADLRVAQVAIPAYANKAIVAGVVRNASTGVAVAGGVVTISGPTNLLFRSGDVDKRGSITLIAHPTTGEFSVEVYSTTAQKDTVVTVTALGNSATTKLTFTGIGVGEGTSLVITAPDNVEPASTVQVKAKLTDAFGNPVTAAAGRMKVTYTGPGIIFGTLPTATDTAGELMFSALLGAADKGSITVVVSYDQNGDGDFVDAKDLNTTKTITVGAAAAVPSADQKVNAGSFKGFVAVYAKGYEGQRLSAKIGNDWVIVPALASNFVRVTDFTGAGVSISVRIYIDRVLTATIPLVTK